MTLHDVFRRWSPQRASGWLLGGAVLALATWELPAQAPPTLIVSKSGGLTSIGAALQVAGPGTRIFVRAGIYSDSTVVVSVPVQIIGEAGAILDGEGARQVMTITANDVTVRGLTFRNVGTSYVEDRSAIKVTDAERCTIESNRFDNTFFGIYLANVTTCRIANNVLRGATRGESASANGIHVWSSRNITIDSNTVSGHRDGLYFEFVHASTARGNVSERNHRYGLHFMYSDDCRYLDNSFSRNGSGVAVMYTKRVTMIGNRFDDNWGSAAYGLLLKEISDPVLTDNRFARNSIGLFADGATRLRADGNVFVDNGWAVKLMASTEDARFAGNSFVGNAFDVATNSRGNANAFDGNYWDEYQGYDLNRDGAGDIPHRPVRLFSLLVAENEPSLILMRSFFVSLLDIAERVLPSLTPELLVDAHPVMKRTR